MRVEYVKCDACKHNLGEDDRARGRLLTIRATFLSEDLDICSECWRKMCDAVGLDKLFK